MKRLFLLRHAKTERDSPSGSDFDRRLTERGESDATAMGMAIRHLGLSFDLILSSPAARARRTAELAGLEPRFCEEIYYAPTGRLLGLVKQADNSATTMIMVGHNPGFEQLGAILTAENLVMPTGSLVEIALSIEQWRDAGAARGRMVRFLKPKELD